jgi:Na+-transporting NADH:ubiquinone oxidoreductase subunit F
MLDIVVGVTAFATVVVALVLVLLGARRRLVASGAVAVVVNEDPSKALEVQAGNTLLGALASRQIYIPSGCGGRGTCGACEVVVKEGGGQLLPTETGFISPGQARRGYRLACQVKVKRDMKIELPSEIFSVRKWQCRVLSNRNVSTFIKELKLGLPEGEDVPFRAGGYVQIECPPHRLEESPRAPAGAAHGPVSPLRGCLGCWPDSGGLRRRLISAAPSGLRAAGQRGCGAAGFGVRGS